MLAALRQRLRDQPLARKMLTLNIVGITVTMFLSLLLFSWLEFHSARQRLAEDVLADAQLMAINLAPMLEFNDRGEAESLVASFHRRANVLRVSVYDVTHHLFVDQAVSGLGEIALPTAAEVAELSGDMLRFNVSSLMVLVPVVRDGERVGALRILCSLDQIQKGIRDFMAVGLLVTLLCIAGSSLILNRMQIRALAPVIQISDLAERIGQEHSYHLRAEIVAEDEIGRLARRFNEMLERIEGRTLDLNAEIDLRRQSELELDLLARHDPLTGLPNRLAFNAELEAAVAAAMTKNLPMALLFIDLDNFKRVNDTFGHQAGDVVLQVTAKRLSGLLRESDRLFRLGGDEFAAILSGVESTETVRNLGRRLVDAAQQPISVELDTAGIAEAKIGASIGAAFAPSQASSREDLLHRADVAMYAAKRAGKNTVRVYESQMET